MNGGQSKGCPFEGEEMTESHDIREMNAQCEAEEMADKMKKKLHKTRWENHPYCGYPYGSHEFDVLPDISEDDCCIHCGKPRRECWPCSVCGGDAWHRKGCPFEGRG